MDSLSSIETESYVPLRVQVYNVLKDAILTGELKPGEHLVEEKICGQLGVSRSPFREALRRLEGDGLVSIIPRQGARVTELTRQDLADLSAVREALEGLASALAAVRITPEELDELDAFCDGMERSIVARDAPAILEFNSLYHRAVVRASRNVWLGTLMSSLREQTRRAYNSSVVSPSRVPRSLAEHRAVIQALRNGDALAAERLSREHVRLAEQAAVSSVGSDAPCCLSPAKS